MLKYFLILAQISFIKTAKVELNLSYANENMKDSSQHALSISLHNASEFKFQ